MKNRHLAFIIPVSMLSIGCSTDDVVGIIIDDNITDSNQSVMRGGDNRSIEQPNSMNGEQQHSQDNQMKHVSGKVIDGYVYDADVFIDLNKNGEFDNGEPFTKSDNNGSYIIETELKNGSFPIIAKGGFDTITQKPFEGVLKTVLVTDETNSSSLVISPATTLVAEEFFNSKTEDLNKAKEKVSKITQIDVEDIDKDFIANKDLETFKKNQQILTTIEKLSIYAKQDSKDISDTAIQTILETNSLDEQVNIKKLGEKLGVDIRPKEGAFTEADSENTPIASDTSSFEDISFEEKMRAIQEQNRAEIDKTKDKLEPVKPAPNNQDNGELLDEVQKLKSEIDTQYENAMKRVKNSPNKTSSEIPLKLNSVIDLNTKEYKNPTLNNLATVEKRGFKYIEEATSIDDIDALHKSIDENFNDVFNEIDSRFEEISKIKPTLLSQLPYSKTTSYGDEAKYVIDSQDGKSVKVKVTISNKNGTKLSGFVKAPLDGDIILTDAQSSYLDLSGKLTADSYNLDISRNGNTIEGSGTVKGLNGATLNAKSFKYGSTIEYSGTIESGEYQFDGDFRETTPLDSYDNSNLSVGPEITSQYANNNLVASYDLYIKGTLTQGDKKKKFTLTQKGNRVSISDFSMKFGDEVTLSFDKATVENKTPIAFTENSIDVQDSKKVPLEGRVVKSENQADFPQPPSFTPSNEQEYNKTKVITDKVVITSDNDENPPSLPNNAVQSPTLTVSNIDLAIQSEFGEFHFKGNYSVKDGLIKREGVSTLDGAKVDGVVSLCYYDRNNIRILDTLLTTEENGDLKLRLTNIDGEVSAILGFDSNYQIFVKSDSNNLTAVDSKGEVFEKSLITQ